MEGGRGGLQRGLPPVGAEPRLPRPGVCPAPGDPRARSALTWHHGNGAAPAGRGLGRT